jgi:hypothetical protein
VDELRSSSWYCATCIPPYILLFHGYFDQVSFKKRWELRVTLCGKRTKRSEQQRKEEKSQEGGNDAVETNKTSSQDIPGNSRNVSKKQKAEDKDGKKINPALRRINLKVLLFLLNLMNVVAKVGIKTTFVFLSLQTLKADT